MSSTWKAANIDDQHEIEICNMCNDDRNMEHKRWSERTTLKSDFENLIWLCFRLLEKSVVQERFVQILDNAVLQALKEKGDVFKVFAFE